MSNYVRITHEFWEEILPGETAEQAYKRVEGIEARGDLDLDTRYINIVDEDGEIIPDEEVV